MRQLCPEMHFFWTHAHLLDSVLVGKGEDQELAGCIQVFEI